MAEYFFEEPLVFRRSKLVRWPTEKFTSLWTERFVEGPRWKHTEPRDSRRWPL